MDFPIPPWFWWSTDTILQYLLLSDGQPETYRWTRRWSCHLLRRQSTQVKQILLHSCQIQYRINSSFDQRRRIWKHDNEAEGEMLGSNPSWRSVEVEAQPRFGKSSLSTWFHHPFFSIFIVQWTYLHSMMDTELKAYLQHFYHAGIHFSDLSRCPREWKRGRNCANCVQCKVR